MNTARKIQQDSLTKTCLFCEAEVIGGRSDKKYCSSTCKDKANNQRNGFVRIRKSKAETEENFLTLLSVIRGGGFTPSKFQSHIENFWLFCHAALWNTQSFSGVEKENFKKLIAEYFKNSENLDETFKELVERVCLAKRYVLRHNGRYISKPIDWLNINYKNGLAGTKNWYLNVEQQRAIVPHYNQGISLLAKAVLKYSEGKNILDTMQYCRELIKQKQIDLLQIYINAIDNLQFSIF
jgi:hypothetical protein